MPVGICNKPGGISTGLDRAAYQVEMTADKMVYELDYTEPCCIVMGSEENGVFPALMKICDEKIKIPMAGGFESLNVSVATGIILYETMKQRNPQTS